MENNKVGTLNVVLLTQQWEYKVFHVLMLDTGLEEFLNRWGDQGWILVQATERPSSGWQFFFKRPIHKEVYPTRE